MRQGIAILCALLGASGMGCGGGVQEAARTELDVSLPEGQPHPEAAATTQAPSTDAALKRPQGLGRASSVVAVKDAAIAAGYACPHWVQDNVVTHADESGHCSGGDVFVWYATEERFTKGHRQMLANKQLIEDVLHRPADPLLVGPNWMITSAGVSALQPKLGGTLE